MPSAAPRYGWSAADELLLYVIHGALHLAGYDDLTKSQAAEMRTAETEYLQRLGVERRSPASQFAPRKTAKRTAALKSKSKATSKSTPDKSNSARAKSRTRVRT
jgi:hypothetical protein